MLYCWTGDVNMLKIIEGGNHSDREAVFINSIKNSAEQGNDVLVVIPDQFSFEYDKKLYDALGGKLFNKIKTAGFNRLAELIFKDFGFDDKDKADDNALIIIMYKAIKKFKSQGDVRFYNKSLDKSSFISDVLSLIDEFVRSGIDAKTLRIVSEKVEGRLSYKLYDLARIYEYFNDELDKMGLKNNFTALNECSEIVEKHECFKDKSVFINAFTDFSVDEYKLIELMLKQGKNLVVSLVASYNEQGNINSKVFAETIRTASKLKELATQYNVECEEIKIPRSFDKNVSLDIAHIEENIFNPKFSSVINGDDSKSNVKIMSATDVYEEIEYVCAETFRLIRDEGYKFKDIAVLAGNVEEISSVVEGTFERYNIPYFIDIKQGAKNSILVIYLNSIFECVLTRQWNTEKILKYIKSPLSAFWDYDICDLENYCISWNVSGDMWNHEFSAKANEGSIKRINENREKIIKPLREFKEAGENASAKDICVAFYKLLDEIRLSQQLFSKIKIASSLKNDNELELSREFKQLWQTVLSAVSSIYKYIGDEKISLREFYNIFSLMISQMSVSNPPQKLDSVRIASTNHSRLSDVKIAFVVETNEGIFPKGIKNNGLLTIRDKKEMEKADVNVTDNSAHQIESERLDVYQALTLPTDKLYITYSESDTTGEIKIPSNVVSMVGDIFPNCEDKIQNLPITFFCTSYRTALYKYLEKGKEKNTDIFSIRESIRFSDEYEQRLKSIQNSAGNREHQLSDALAKKTFFSNDLNISPTRVNDYYKCPFMFFCKYGLKLGKTVPVEMNKMNIGSLVHSCFEKIMSKKNENGEKIYNEDFLHFSDDIIKETIHSEFKNYVEENMGGDFGKNATFLQSQKRSEELAFFAVKNIQKEFEDCLFKPVAFEYNLTKDNKESIFTIKVDDDIRINIRGSIDRVDIAEDKNGERYVRIVDYKTGSTELKLDELYNGLNLQMIIYILAVTQGINNLNCDGNLNPAAILYSHIKSIHTAYNPEQVRTLKENDEFEDDLMITKASNFAPDGLVINNEFTISAFNKKLNNSFTPFKKANLNTDENKIIDDSITDKEYFLGLEEFARQKICNMANNLKSGSIPADPLQRGNSLPCTYCDYWGICGNASPKNPREVSKSDSKKLEEELNEIVKNM